MAYADYAYYRDEFHGTSISEELFPSVAERASEYIDYITMGKAERNAALPQVKKACCALAEDYQVIEKAKRSSADEGGELSSQTVGSWSQSYRSGAETATEYQKQLYSVAQQYLGPTGLLYRGRCFACPCFPTL